MIVCHERDVPAFLYPSRREIAVTGFWWMNVSSAELVVFWRIKMARKIRTPFDPAGTLPSYASPERKAEIANQLRASISEYEKYGLSDMAAPLKSELAEMQISTAHRPAPAAVAVASVAAPVRTSTPKPAPAMQISSAAPPPKTRFVEGTGGLPGRWVSESEYQESLRPTYHKANVQRLAWDDAAKKVIAMPA